MILVDTGALYALIDRNDINHEEAKKFYQKIVGKESLVILIPVLTEAWLLIDARLGIHFANKIWQAATNGIFEIIDLKQEDLRGALEIENKYKEVGFGFIDAACFYICEKYKIRKVFTYDRKHFSIFKPKFTNSLEILP